jgi:hypothetical protein
MLRRSADGQEANGSHAFAGGVSLSKKQAQNLTKALLEKRKPAARECGAAAFIYSMRGCAVIPDP